MVAICNTDNKENNKRLYSYIFAYESILRADLPPSAKVVAQILVYQGALNECGCCITNEVLGSFTLLDVATVQRQTGVLTKQKYFIVIEREEITPTPTTSTGILKNGR